MSSTRREFTTGALGLALLPSVARATATSGWRRLQTEPYRGKQDDIAFVDPDTGWYGNGAGKLFRTSDGGETWTKVADRPGTFIRALGFLDAKTGFIANVGTNYYPGVTDTQPLYRTDDGGSTWQPIVAAGMEKIAGVCAVDVLPVKRVYQGEVQLSHIIHAAGRVGGPAAMLVSKDAGLTWKVIDLSEHAGMILDVKFLDERVGFLCAATSADLKTAEALILRTPDGGRSWKRVYQSGRPLENCWKMSWPSKRVGYATVQSYDQSPANTNRVIVKTVDGGRSWRELPLVQAPKVQEFGIGFVDERRGWVGCTTGGYATSDGGASWTPVDFGPAVNKIRVTRAKARTRVFAIGVQVARLDL